VSSSKENNGIAGGFSNVKKIGSDGDFRKVVKNFQLLCWRTFSEQSRNIPLLTFKFCFTTFFALVIGGIYSNIGDSQRSIQNRNGALFFITIQQVFATYLGCLSTFPIEKAIVNRERSGQAYDIISYFVAKVIIELPLNILPTIVFDCIVY
jgi:hypothetical protein